jgi:hypothetical protein
MDWTFFAEHCRDVVILVPPTAERNLLSSVSTQR